MITLTVLYENDRRRIRNVAGGCSNGTRRSIERTKSCDHDEQENYTLNPGQGFTANLVTSFLVILASRFGVPVSTTHVSVGSLFGIGLIMRAQTGGSCREF